MVGTLEISDMHAYFTDIECKPCIHEIIMGLFKIILALFDYLVLLIIIRLMNKQAFQIFEPHHVININ